jgi:hypothetical protein
VEIDVFVAGWEIECCQPPPGEGNRVTWPLQWMADSDGVGVGEVENSWHVQPGPADRGALLVHGPLTLSWPGTVADLPATGFFMTDLHAGAPDEVPPTSGTVLGVQVVTQTYRLDPRGFYAPVPGEFELRSVPRSPRWFDGGDSSIEPNDRPDVSRSESGVLVRLAVETPG